MQHEKVMSSGVIDACEQEDIKEIFAPYEVHLVVKESAPSKGIHFHYVVLHEGTRNAMRQRLKRKLLTQATCVDPSNGSNTWQKAKQYVCKEDPVIVVSRSGIEFSDENIEKYHEKYHEVKEDIKNKRIGKKRMEILHEACQGLEEYEPVRDKVCEVFKEEGWICDPNLAAKYIRTVRVQNPDGMKDFKSEIDAKFTYSELKR